MSALLTAPYETRRILDKYGIRAKKKFGQNFLIHGDIVRGIVAAAGVTKDDCVLEIGPGIGTMTQELSLAAGQVVAVEIDTTLEPVLAETLDGCTNVTILWQDILKTDLPSLRDTYNGGRRLKCVANLPYYITTPILLQLLRQRDVFESITVMVQKEVAERILAIEKDKEYGALSLAVRYYSVPRVDLSVPPSSFTPRPAVDSTVLTLTLRDTPPVEADEAFLFALIRASFNQRRKTLANGLSHGFSQDGWTLTREDVVEALAALSLPADVRGEKLSLEQFADLANELEKRRKCGNSAPSPARNE